MDCYSFIIGWMLISYVKKFYLKVLGEWYVVEIIVLKNIW